MCYLSQGELQALILSLLCAIILVITADDADSEDKAC